MGAWATDSFGIDTACDWSCGLEKTNDLSLVESAPKAVTDAADECCDASAAEEAIAAAEVVARLKGRFAERNSYTKTTDDWAAQHPQRPSAELVALAASALKRIETAPSELPELWSESEEFEGWKKSMADLKARLTK